MIIVVAAAVVVQNRIVHLELRIPLFLVAQVHLGANHGEQGTEQVEGRPLNALEVPLILVLVKAKVVQELMELMVVVVVDNMAAVVVAASEVLPVAVVTAM